MNWFARASAVVLLVALASWLLLSRSGDSASEQRESSLQTNTFEASIQTEEAEDAAPSRRDSRAERAVLASLDESRTAAPSSDDRSIREGWRAARLEIEKGNDQSLHALQEKIRAADALPAERRYLSSGHLNGKVTLERLGSEAFSMSIDELAREAYGDFDAQALSDVYSGYVDSFLEPGGGFALERLVCGMRVCLGEALALSDNAHWPHFGLYSSQHGGPPMYASAYDAFTTPDGMIVYQFLFTTDPESRGISLPSP